MSVFRRPGSDLLFRVLRRSTIGAGAIYGRVRDAKRFRRYGLAGIISLLSAGSTFYSLDDGPPHVEPPDHYDRLSTLLDLSVSKGRQAYAIALGASGRQVHHLAAERCAIKKVPRPLPWRS
jgi:hypothetical protein